MEVLINDSKIDLMSEDGGTFGDLVEKAEKYATDNGKIITQITWNGEVVTPEEEATKQDQEFSGSDKITMLMEKPGDVMINALNEADSDIPVISEKLRKVAEYLQTGARQAAYSLFSECIEQWRQVINLFRIVESAADMNTEEISVQGVSLDRIQGELLDLLVETKKSMQEDDSVALSDIIEYELAPSIERQKDVIDVLKQILKEE